MRFQRQNDQSYDDYFKLGKDEQTRLREEIKEKQDQVKKLF